MRFVRLNSSFLSSEFFWLAFVFCLTAAHLPSWLEIVSTCLFVALVWQIQPKSKGAFIGLTLAIAYGLSFVLALLVWTLPNGIWLKIAPSPTPVPAQMAFMTSYTSMSGLVPIVCVALLRYYDAHPQERYASCLRFVAASSIFWGSITFVAERFAAPAKGIYAPLEPLVPLVLFVAAPVSFLFWHFKSPTWLGSVLRAGAALLMVAAGYFALVFGASGVLVMVSRQTVLAILTLGGAIATKMLNPYQAVVVLTWAAVLPFISFALDGGIPPMRGWGRKYPAIAPVFAFAAASMVASFALDAHKQHIETQAKLAEDAKDELARQKINAFVRWRINLPRDAPKVLATLGPPMIGPDGTAYVVARAESRLHAIDPSGQVKWSFSGVLSAEPAVGRDTVYVVGTDKTLYALNEADGQVRWSTNFDEGRALICTGPALADDGTIYTLTQTNTFNLTLSASSPNGHLNWQLSTPSEHMCSTRDRIEMFPQLLPAPVAGHDGMIYFTNEGRLHAIDSKGVERWSALTDRPVARVVLGPNGAIYTYGENITAFNFDGQEQWSRRRRSAPSAAPSIGGDGTIYFPDYGGAGSSLIALHPDGSEKWTSREVPGSAVLAAPNGIIYVSTPGLCALDSEGHRLDWNYGYGIPAIAPDGTIYSVEHDGDLYRLNPPTVVAQSSSR